MVGGRDGDEGPGRAAARRDGSRVRGFVITLVVLLALVVGADFAVRSVAEDQVATRLQKPLRLPEKPTADINGLLFLPQALAGRYGDVVLTGGGITYGKLRDVTLSVDLKGVRLPLQSLIDRDVTSIPTDTVEASARVGPADLARALGVSEVTVEPVTQSDLDTRIAAAEADDSGAEGSADTLRDIDPSNSVSLTSTVTVAGQDLQVAVIASFRLSGSRIAISARDIRLVDGPSGTTGRLAAAALRSRLSGFSTEVDPGSLPFSITATDVRADNGDLVVSGTAQDVDLLDGVSS